MAAADPVQTRSGGSNATRAALAVALIAAAGLLAFKAGYELVDEQAPHAALAFFFFAAICLVVASSLVLRVESGSKVWAILHWWALVSLATALVFAFGFFAIGWTQHASVAIRIAAQIGCAALAGVALVVPPVSSASLVYGSLTAAQNLLATARVERHVGRLGAPADDAVSLDAREGEVKRTERYAVMLSLAAESWRMPPWSRLKCLAARCVGMTVAGVTVSIVAQSAAYAMASSRGVSAVLAPLLGWLAGCAAGWWGVGKLIDFTPDAHQTRHVMHGLGFATVAVTLLVAIIAAWSAHISSRRLFDHREHLDYGLTVPVGDRITNDQLARLFKPALRFSSNEPWHPTTVHWFWRHTTPKSGPACPKGCRVLAPDCDTLTDGCTGHAPASPMIYSLVKPIDGNLLPKPYKHVTQIIQYWFFYNYDSFNRWLVSQWHEGDWEQMTVGVGAKGPLFVAYSEHCFGAVLDWSDVAVFKKTHPISWVAEGTHANYPRPFAAPLRGGTCLGKKNLAPPRYVGIAGVLFGLVSSGGSLEVAGDYGTGETDRIGNDKRVFPVRVIKWDGPIADYSGTWGSDNRLALFRGRGKKFGAAPSSPAHHTDWTDPATGIICNPKWFVEPSVDCPVSP
jgi:hypothetical protein